jgi:hypothetical protein
MVQTECTGPYSSGRLIIICFHQNWHSGKDNLAHLEIIRVDNSVVTIAAPETLAVGITLHLLGTRIFVWLV